MEPIGAAKVARATIHRVEIVDPIEAIQAHERRAVALTGLRDDGIDTRRWQPAADAEYARMWSADGAHDRFVLGSKRVQGRGEADIVGAQLDGDQRRVGGGDGAELRDRPG